MNTKYWVGLSSVETTDSEIIIGLYNKLGDIRLVYEANEDDLRTLPNITKKRAESFLKNIKTVDVDKAYEGVIRRDLKVITYEDSNYPYMLKNISNPPAVLYYKGDLSCCNLERTLAVIGSRRISYEGKQSLKKVMNEFINTDLCIVSGLATGADTAAHRFALDNGLKTIGVIAGGMDNFYPPSNRKLFEEIINGNGAVISESYPTVEPLPFRFPQRNRIVSGLSYGTLVVEAALKSGALITANLTLEQGRELLCIPGLITNPNTEGIYKLIKTGATIVTCGEDVLNGMNWVKETQQTLFDVSGLDSVTDSEENNDLTVDEKKILNTINIEPKSFDEIQALTKITTDELLIALTNLELNGSIELGLGDRYRVL